ncbi:MAG: hypothetical protein ABJQ29_04345 [Luteolibacter sp.]
MDFIFDNIIWFVMAAAGLVQWWKSTQEAKMEQAAEEARRREARDYEEFIEEAEMRLPKAAVPPPLPAGGAAQAPELRRSNKRAVADAPPLPDMGSELERQALLAEQIREFKRAKKTRSPVFDHRKKVKPTTTGSIGVKARLGNRRELKDAFVLKEILEKPVGLR